MSGNIKNISVFCASRLGTDPYYARMAYNCGQMIARNDWTLMYGGGGSGLMGAVANGAHEASGKIKGIMPEVFRGSADRAPESTATEFTGDMAERKQRLIAETDVIIVLPGGIGTLDEVAETLMFNYLEKLHNPDAKIKPMMFIDPEGLYKPLIDFLRLTVERELSDPSVMDTIFCADSVDIAEAILLNWQDSFPQVSLARMPEMPATRQSSPKLF